MRNLKVGFNFIDKDHCYVIVTGISVQNIHLSNPVTVVEYEWFNPDGDAGKESNALSYFLKEIMVIKETA